MQFLQLLITLIFKNKKSKFSLRYFYFLSNETKTIHPSHPTNSFGSPLQMATSTRTQLILQLSTLIPTIPSLPNGNGFGNSPPFPKSLPSYCQLVIVVFPQKISSKGKSSLKPHVLSIRILQNPSFISSEIVLQYTPSGQTLETSLDKKIFTLLKSQTG